jgi:hypothetical protein
MFSVYGKAGRLFRGSMEELRKIGPTSALARTRAVVGTGHELVDDFANQLALTDHARVPGVSKGEGRLDAAHRDAMAAYA